VKHKKIFRILAITFTLALLLMAIPTSVAMAAAAISVKNIEGTAGTNPYYGEAEGGIGDKVKVDGSGFSGGTEYYIYFSSQNADVGDNIDEDVTVYEFVGSPIANTMTGTLYAEFDVPDKLTEGDNASENVHGGVYYIYVTLSTTDSIKAKATFTVTGVAKVTAFAPDEGTVGTEVEIEGEGFAPEEGITVEYAGDDITDEIIDPYADEDGEILLTFLIPESTFGEHTITITGVESLAEIELIFTVESEVTIDIQEGQPGDVVTVSGTGFARRNGVNFSFGGSPITAVWLVATDGRTNADGHFDVKITVPEVAPGNYTILAEDKDNEDIYGQMTFTVTEPPLNPVITASPTSGNVDDEVEVSGEAFPSGEDITVEYDSTDVTAQIVGDSTTGSNGEFSFYLAIPESTAGEHTITVSIEDLEIEVEAVVTVEPKIAIDLTTGPAGTEVEVTGIGFGYRSDITVEFDGDAIDIESGDDRSSIEGSFEFSFIVPAVGQGKYDVVVEDEDGNSADARFTVVVSGATINPTTGINGIEVTVSGTNFVAGSTITITYYLKAGATTGDTEEFTTTAISDGSLSAIFDLPASEGGSHSIIISDGINSVTTSFVVLAEATISPTSGDVGEVVTISGAGFRANTVVTVNYGDTIITPTLPITTGPNGSLSGSFIVPTSAGGDHSITVSDGVNTKLFTFTMDTTPPPIPQQLLPLGNSKPEQPITFDWDDVTDNSMPVTYSLQIASDESYTNIVVNETGLTDSGYTLTEEQELESLGKDESYYWRVRATDAASNNSDWGPNGTFYIGGGWPGWLMWLWIGLGALVIFIFAVWLGRRIAFSSY
jgi:hypothetical protein